MKNKKIWKKHAEMKQQQTDVKIAYWKFWK